LDQVDVDWGGGGPVPYGDARRLTLVAGTGQLSISFVLLLPREHLDAVDVGTDHPGDPRRFRVADFDPEVRASAVAQVAAFVSRLASELAAELLG
jgi:hypothetical protein